MKWTVTPLGNTLQSKEFEEEEEEEEEAEDFDRETS